MAPLWLTMPTGPSSGSTSMNMVEKLAMAPVAKLARPCELGPTMRMPRARARATMAASTALPAAGSLSPKPEVMRTAILTPASPQASIASTAASPGTATIASSGASGRSLTLGQVGQPWVSLRLGLTA